MKEPKNQREAVLRLMRDQRWRTLAEIRREVGGSETGISARLRDLRKREYGHYQVDRRLRRTRVYEYRIARE